MNYKVTNKPTLCYAAKEKGYKVLTESKLIDELLDEEKEVLMKSKAIQEKMKRMKWIIMGKRKHKEHELKEGLNEEYLEERTKSRIKIKFI